LHRLSLFLRQSKVTWVIGCSAAAIHTYVINISLLILFFSLSLW
jgi:hypothetical protein